MKKLVFVIMMLVAPLVSAQEALKTVTIDVERTVYNSAAINNPTTINVQVVLTYSNLNTAFKLGRWLMCPVISQWFAKNGTEMLAIHAHPCYPTKGEIVDFAAVAGRNQWGEFVGSGTFNVSGNYRNGPIVRFGTFGHNHYH